MHIAATTHLDVRLVNRPVEAAIPRGLPEAMHGCGAECVFVGRTRVEAHPEHGTLTRLEYEAYEPMAVRVLNELAQQAARQFGCALVRVHHALGEVPPGEASVVVHVVTGHRAASFDACRFLIDALKKAAPIWKREHWADGTTWSRGQTAAGPEEVFSQAGVRQP